MEPIFILPYSEYEVINLIQNKVKKKDGFSCFIPVSRQQKGIDFILYSSKTNQMSKPCQILLLFSTYLP